MIGKATAIIAAALCANALASPVPGSAPKISGGAAMQSNQPVTVGHTVLVNRANKGDRLPFERRTNETLRTEILVPHRIPLGCDSAFSPIENPKAAHIYGRCLT